MATLTVESIVEAGTNATYNTAAALGDTFANDDSEQIFIHVKNANVGSARQVTVNAAVSSTTKPGFGALSRANIVVSVPASSDRFIGPFPYTAFGENPDIQYDDEADVTVAVLKV